jgi:hypothetical protein
MNIGTFVLTASVNIVGELVLFLSTITIHFYSLRNSQLILKEINKRELVVYL